MSKKKLTAREKLEIINNDPELWLRNFVKITTNTGEVVPFILNEQQRMFVREMERFNIIAKGKADWIFYLVFRFVFVDGYD